MPLGPPNLGPVVYQFSTPGVRRRPGAVAVNADGFMVAAAPVDEPALGHTFPATGDTLRRFGLQDVDGLFEVHANIELLTANTQTGTQADRWLVTIAGQPRVFEVSKSAPWLSGPDGATTWWAAALQEVQPS